MIPIIEVGWNVISSSVTFIRLSMHLLWCILRCLVLVASPKNLATVMPLSYARYKDLSTFLRWTCDLFRWEHKHLLIEESHGKCTGPDDPFKFNEAFKTNEVEATCLNM